MDIDPNKPQPPSTPSPPPGGQAPPRLRLVGGPTPHQHRPAPEPPRAPRYGPLAPQIRGRRPAGLRHPGARSRPQTRPPLPTGSTHPPGTTAQAPADLAGLPGALQANRQSLTIQGAGDPRWVLAVRTAEALEGTVLGPEKRRSLIRLGQAFGLTAFDSNLILAIVQDQARRGHTPDMCARMGVSQIERVPPPRRRPILAWAPEQRSITVALMITGLIACELTAMWWLMR